MTLRPNLIQSPNKRCQLTHIPIISPSHEPTLSNNQSILSQQTPKDHKT